ncbi:gastrula zinc finger protein XlCGF7.1-like [Pimephales promelas]|uniref:gastrula zinc finger protein XlCGF7.1-like n=1 Tax=Pimephales promelas TaxID=90988 RepID=UPI001955E552|nr:gastrula zinc finger protein XlCGF7.1-like [Pimephales promelas]XP_039542898.1 gastrula zinc finger protein XlCGF7.1-like [Pimephales promelas]XP_039542899.1 gastrula zinc finger protein XlCGF7.1-like [Pimephales promelas]
MAFIKEESEDMKIEETFSVKQEDTEEQTDLMALKEETEVLNEMEGKDQYNNHHNFTTGEKTFSCSQTEKTSSQKMAQTPGTRSNLICLQCGKSFKQKGHFKDHMRVHTGEKPYTCKQCGKSFNQKGSLNRHVKIHNREKPYMCPQCGKCFIQKVHFKDHLSIHYGVKPYNCHQCEKSFNQKGILKRHMRTHTSFWKITYLAVLKPKGDLCERVDST